MTANIPPPATPPNQSNGALWCVAVAFIAILIGSFHSDDTGSSDRNESGYLRQVRSESDLLLVDAASDSWLIDFGNGICDKVEDGVTEDVKSDLVASGLDPVLIDDALDVHAFLERIAKETLCPT